ncbi:hypothetical protein AB0D49_04465 [Streptomyces sp. NPDC048290]|uniref:hypothetical protein n=1 Tax=Streptomyces sp. NPDC048290 TaxID=3155811 RepID=UPI0034441B5C
MSIRFTTKARRGMAALIVAAGLVLGAAGCSSGDAEGGDTETESSQPAAKNGGSQPDAQEGQADVPLAELKGPESLLLQINSARRDAGGFVTLDGTLKNDGGDTVNVPAQLSGNETEIIRNGRSLGGATLVDSKSKKRYYVLRDTDGRPLTTTNFPALKAGESLPVFMQFPAPPEGTTEVTFQLPMFAAAPIQISG